MSDDMTIVVTYQGRSRTIVLDAEFPICTLDGERVTIDVLSHGFSAQDAVADLTDSLFPPEEEATA